MHLTADTVKHLQLKGADPLCFLRSKQELNYSRNSVQMSGF